MSEDRRAVQDRKRKLRREHRSRRASLDPDERYDASCRIAERLALAPYFSRSRRIACYLPMAEEVDTWPIIERAWRRKKRIFAPLTGNRRQLVFREVTPATRLFLNDWGLMEPDSGPCVDAKDLDLVVTPLVAFDEKRHRIGMGGGYYDQTFAYLKHRQWLHRPKLVGVAFDCQRVEKIALNPWDIVLYRVLTEATEY